MFQLPEVEINADNRGFYGEGIIINLANESKKEGDSALLIDQHGVSVRRFDPNFFVVSDEEKLAISFIVRLFGLTVCHPDDVGDGERCWRPKNQANQGVVSEPSWLSAVTMSFC